MEKGKRNIDIKVLKQRIITEDEIEVFASLLFHWWRKEYESDTLQRLGNNKVNK
jgi:hypothetical protein